jgi:hypothetical protein
MKKILLLIISILAVIGTVLPAQAFEGGVRGYYWFTSISGDVKLDDGSLDGTKLDLKDDLDIDDESYPVGEAFIGLGDHHLSFSFYRADYKGTATLTKDINVGGETYPVGDRIKSRLEYDVFDLTYQYDLLDLENVLAGFSLGLLGRVRVYDLQLEIRSETLDQSAKEDYTVPIPLLGLNLHLGILADLLEARILASGIGYWDGYMVDAKAELSYTPIPFVDIFGGYRTFLVKVDINNSLELDYDTSGFYAGVGISF